MSTSKTNLEHNIYETHLSFCILKPFTMLPFLTHTRLTFMVTDIGKVSNKFGILMEIPQLYKTRASSTELLYSIYLLDPIMTNSCQTDLDPTA